jgi:L-ribulose-5-phosphate 3-epimerase
MPDLNRRQFLAAGLAAGATACVAQPARAASWKTKIHTALIGTPDEAALESWKAAGFEGYESTACDASPEKAEAARKLAQKHGMRVHSVMFGWANFNHPEKFEADLARVETAIAAAQAYGADTVLLVPCRLDEKIRKPQAWEFDIRFDATSGHLKQVIAGDNGPFSDYIAAHNRSADAARDAVRRLIPAAEKAGRILAIENVWNNMWVEPDFFRSFVAQFESPWVRAYFDIGNHVKYARPEKWIRTLGKLIVKCHVKDFKLNDDGHGGHFVAIREGSVNWPEVRKAWDVIGYDGWASIEGSENLSVAERGRRLDLILEGK